MPYIITTTRTDFLPTTAGLSKRTSRPTRRAVATLGEALSVACDVYEYATGVIGGGTVADTLTGSGGTIGPLPDGTVIEVERVEPSDLGQRFGLIPADHAQLWPVATLVERYNAAQA